ncbi:MAG: cycX [Myxococcales bacterium]|nr:cycX [Myxococcales bacterium]
MRRVAGWALLAGLAALFVLRIVQLGHGGMPKVATASGSPAPDFEARLLDGGRFHLAAERGHPVVLVFWASWCGPCMAELPGIERVAQILRKPGHTANLVAVNTEGDRDAAAGAVQRLGLSMRVALDDGGASASYHVRTIPHTVIVDAAGKIAAVMRGMSTEDELLRAILEVEERTGASP